MVDIISICGVSTSQAGLFHTTMSRNSLRGRTAQRSNTSAVLGCGLEHTLIGDVIANGDGFAYGTA